MQQMAQSMIVKPTSLVAIQTGQGRAGLSWAELSWAGAMHLCLSFVCLASSISVPQIDGCAMHLCVLPSRGHSTVRARVAQWQLPRQLLLPQPLPLCLLLLIGCIRHGPRGPSIMPSLVTNQRAFGYATGICGRAVNPVKLLN